MSVCKKYCIIADLRDFFFLSHKKSPPELIFIMKCSGGDFLLYPSCTDYYLYSSQLLISMSSMLIVQKAWMKALARRAFVINGMFRSMAARRIL